MKIFNFILLFWSFSFAQNGINTTTPEAELDIVSTNNGFLIPRMALTASNSSLPLTTPSDSELVYNTASVGVFPNNVVPGFYSWSTATATWTRMSNVTRSSPESASTIVEPNAAIPGPIGPLVSVGSYVIPYLFEAEDVTRTLTVTGLVGNIANVTLNFQFAHNQPNDADIFLESPTGQIIELSTDNGGTSPTATNSITFSDAAASSITSWTTGLLSGSFRPEGGVVLAAVSLTDVATISNMASFTGNPNGVWKVHFRDDTPNTILFDFKSFELSIATFTPSIYRLVDQASAVYKAEHNVITKATYSANCSNNEGFITALAYSTAPGVIGTTSATVPGTVVSYAADSPRQAAGDFWATTFNQSITSGLVDGTTYYYQLWAKVNVDLPQISNENFSVFTMLIPQ
jgi:hypothetical protein